MKLAKVIFTGILIWAASLIWPQVNQWLTDTTLLWGVIGLSGLMAGYLMIHLHRHPNNGANISPSQQLQRDLTETKPFHPISIG
jgi:hypothetical protein